MLNTAIALHCPNPNCQYPNPITHQFCQQCRTVLVKRYLWVAGQGIGNYRAGDLLQNRFLVESTKVLLDTQPAIPIENEDFDPALVKPYLKLFSYRPHIPQPYYILALENSTQEVLLLEQAPIAKCDLAVDRDNEPSVRSAMPLERAWFDASPMRQLNWLWQIAQLWQPLVSQGVVSTLLEPTLIRVEGSLVRLLELRQDRESTPTLGLLGQMWQRWLPKDHPAIESFLDWLCTQLVTRQIQTAEQLIDCLDEQLQQLGRSHSYQFTITAQTDRGPTRPENEDACYSTDNRSSTAPPFTIVCDGMGGHDGGEIASDLATQTIAQHVQRINSEFSDSSELIAKINDAIYNANDLIHQHNSQQHRQQYKRMGTTLVMALAHPPKMYVAHVGDSRAYWITRTGCYQVTTDDNLISRCVESGLSFYRDAFYYHHDSRLLQALGIAASDVLQPRIRQLAIDEDCIFLLCSDGLSDNDRVEEFWKTALLPVLAGQIDLATASRSLIDLANHKNGHDNVTVSLVYCQVS